MEAAGASPQPLQVPQLMMPLMGHRDGVSVVTSVVCADICLREEHASAAEAAPAEAGAAGGGPCGGGGGVSFAYFDAVHTKLSSGAWTRSDEEWHTQITYVTPAHSEDSDRTPVHLRYGQGGGSRLGRVDCFRERTEDPGFSMGLYNGKEELVVTTRRVFEESARPPPEGCRFTQVNIEVRREFERVSSANAFVRFKFILSKRWRAHCAYDAYQATPTYHVRVVMSVDRAGGSVNESWLVDNFLGKLVDVCFGSSFVPLP